MLYVKSLAHYFPMIDTDSFIGHSCYLGELYTLEHGIAVSRTCSVTRVSLNHGVFSRMADWWTALNRTATRRRSLPRQAMANSSQGRSTSISSLVLSMVSRRARTEIYSTQRA